MHTRAEANEMGINNYILTYYVSFYREILKAYWELAGPQTIHEGCPI
jgi:hypothetical protein